MLWHGRNADALASLDDLQWMSDDKRADVEEFIAEMEMGREELLEIRSSGPSLFDDEIAVDTLARDDKEVRGAAHVITTDEPAPAEVAYPTALVRYEVGEDSPGTMRVEITDGWNGAREFSVER